MALRLRRTNFPDDLKSIASWWFTVDGEDFGVSMARWDHGAQWEVFHAATLGSVRDDWDRLADLRAEAEEECRFFLVDLRAEEREEEADRG